MAWKDIAKKLGISDTRVMQIYDGAILKIKAMLKEPEFEDIRIDYEGFLKALDSTKPTGRTR